MTKCDELTVSSWPCDELTGSPDFSAAWRRYALCRVPSSCNRTELRKLTDTIICICRTTFYKFSNGNNDRSFAVLIPAIGHKGQSAGFTYLLSSRG